MSDACLDRTFVGAPRSLDFCDLRSIACRMASFDPPECLGLDGDQSSLAASAMDARPHLSQSPKWREDLPGEKRRMFKKRRLTKKQRLPAKYRMTEKQPEPQVGLSPRRSVTLAQVVGVTPKEFRAMKRAQLPNWLFVSLAQGNL